MIKPLTHEDLSIEQHIGLLINHPDVPDMMALNLASYQPDLQLPDLSNLKIEEQILLILQHPDTPKEVSDIIRHELVLMFNFLSDDNPFRQIEETTFYIAGLFAAVKNDQKWKERSFADSLIMDEGQELKAENKSHDDVADIPVSSRLHSLPQLMEQVLLYSEIPAVSYNRLVDEFDQILSDLDLPKPAKQYKFEIEDPDGDPAVFIHHALNHPNLPDTISNALCRGLDDVFNDLNAEQQHQYTISQHNIQFLIDAVRENQGQEVENV